MLFVEYLLNKLQIKAKKYKVSTSTATERCEPPRANTSGGDSLCSRRESPITSARANSAEISRNFNDQSEIEEVSYNLQVIDDDMGDVSQDKTTV